MTRLCIICGAAYQVRHVKQRICSSPPCLREDNRRRARAHRLANLEEVRAKDRVRAAAFRAEHPDVSRARVKAAMSKPAAMAKARANMRRYYWTEPDKFRARSRDYYRRHPERAPHVLTCALRELGLMRAGDNREASLMAARQLGLI